MASQDSSQTHADLLAALEARIAHVVARIRDEEKKISTLLETYEQKRAPTPVEEEIRRNLSGRVRELARAESSPFFAQCILDTVGNEKNKILYFGKQELSSEGIYSWTAPIARIRFEEPGEVMYTKPDGTEVHTILVDKEQYLIVDGRVVFFAKESLGTPRELIHHDYFSTKKSAFELPEIVAIMEKAQDTVIRAHYKGPFVISGPAGSGKTTLAFHRIAYLLQSPDTAPHFPDRSVIIFVQDKGTKEYFSHLLPRLGIEGITITTFVDWTMEILGSSDVHYGDTHARDNFSRLHYESLKLGALSDSTLGEIPYSKNIFTVLAKAYATITDPKFASLFSQQKKERTIDRIDITILLTLFIRTHGQLKRTHQVTTVGKDGAFRTKKEKTTPSYSLMLIDEFQNYLPAELSILRSCLFPATQSVIYVGDLRQQIRLGSIRDFTNIKETITEERNIILHKVYRNTKQILTFIRTLGYTVDIPENIKNGPLVEERIIMAAGERCAYIAALIAKNPTRHIGILCNNQSVAESVRTEVAPNEHVHVSTISEAQGIEFDIVCLVGTWEVARSDDVGSALPLPLHDAIARINKDILYIGLTRAIDELYIIGDKKLSDVVHDNEAN